MSTSLAWGQSGPSAPAPPVFPTVDQNGVDLTTGQLYLEDLETSVGRPGEGALSRIITGVGLRDSNAGTIGSAPKAGAPGTTIYTVSLGASSVRFEQATAGGTLTPKLGAVGQALVYSSGSNTYTLTQKDGTVAIFSGAIKGSVPIDAQVAFITSLTRPNGEVLTFTYDSADSSCGANCSRLRAVTSSLGYAIKYEYAGTSFASLSTAVTKVTAYGQASSGASDWCDPLANGCTYNNTWNSVTVSGGNYGFSTYTVTDSLSQQTTYTFSFNQLASITRPSGEVIHFYWTSGRISAVQTDAGIWSYGYGNLAPNNDLQTTVTDPLNHVRTVVASATTGAVISDIDSLGNGMTYVTDPTTGLVTRVERPEGDYDVYTYDGRGNVTTLVQYPKPGSTLPAKTTTIGYDAVCGNPKTCNKPNYIIEGGAQTDLAYDPTHGGVLTITAPAPAPGGVRPQQRLTYTALYAWYRKDSSATFYSSSSPIYKLTSLAQCITLSACSGGADEAKTTLQYVAGSSAIGTNLLVSQETTGSSSGGPTATRAYTYNIFGDLKTVDGPLSGTGDTIRFRYDTVRRRVGVIDVDPDGQGTGRPASAVRTTYRPDGLISSVDYGAVASQSDADWSTFTIGYTWAFTYDVAGRPITKKLVGSNGVTQALTQLNYDGDSRIYCVAQRMNPALFSSLPSSACALGTQGSYGPDRITRYQYSDDDRVQEIDEAIGTPDGRMTSYTAYTQNGRVLGVMDGNYNETDYEYDGFDRLVRTSFPIPTGGGVSTTDYTQVLLYDPVSWDMKQTRRRDGQIVTYTYDALHRITAKDAPSSSYSYDNLGRVRSATQGGQTVSSAYDALGRMTSTTGPLGAISYAYDAAGRRSGMTWPDAFYVNYDFDTADNLTAIRENGATSGAGVLATFGYDNQNRRSTLTRGNGVVTTYGYDVVSRLSSLNLDLNGSSADELLTFAYNPAGQLTSRTSNNSAYAFTDLANVSRAYSVNGLNQVSSTSAGGVTTNLSHDLKGNVTSDGARAYTFDVDNRLTGLASGATFAYDAADHLTQSTTSGGTVTKLLYDGDDLVGEYNSAGALLRRYVHGPSVDEPLAWYEGAGVTDRRWLIADQQGSIVAVTGGPGVPGALFTYTYDEYGVPGSANQGRFQYTGQAWLPEAAVYNYKSRTYSPTYGRFMQVDRIGYGDGMNAYAYVHNDPANDEDPFGFGPGDPGDMVAGVTVNGHYVPPSEATETLVGVSFGGGPTSLATMGFAGPACNGGCVTSTVEGITVIGQRRRTNSIQDLRQKQAEFAKGSEVIDRENSWMLIPVLAPEIAIALPEMAVGGLIRACNCFEAGTLVQTPDGSRPIETIRVGDLVLSRDAETGVTVAKPVVALIPGKTRPIWNLTVTLASGAAGSSQETIHTTEEHPFRTAGAAWTPASQLQPGQQILTSRGDLATVASIVSSGRSAPTYNLEIEDFHTYFVGDAGLWVHNSCLTPIGRALAKKFGRAGSKFGQVKGSASDISKAAQQIYDDIVANGVKTSRYHARFGDVVEYRLPDVGGVRLGADGRFIGFLEP